MRQICICFYRYQRAVLFSFPVFNGEIQFIFLIKDRFPSKMNDGAAGWIYSPYQHSYLWDLKSVKQKRGPLRYDGEIDHGLTSGIMGAGIYLLKDPDLGMVAYGGNVEVDKKGYVSIMPYDGIRRQLRIFTPARIAVEFLLD